MERVFIDQMNRTIRLEGIPSRIVSLVPSQTELLHDLGLGDEVVGITKFCIYPEEWYRNKTRVGGTKQVDIDRVRELKPDLIIGNKEENTKSDIAELEKIAPVWMSDINSFEEALSMIESIGSMTGRTQKSRDLIDSINERFKLVNAPLKKKTVLYYIWKDPGYVVGSCTFINSMLEKAGFENYCKQARYPEWSISKEDHPDLIFLSSEPYPFKEEHQKEFQLLFPHSKIILVDGELFSWYGSRMKLAPSYFRELFFRVTP